MMSTIVAAIRGDDDGSRDALALAAALARPTGAHLVLAAVWSSPLGAGASSYERALRTELEREVDAVAAGVPEGAAAQREIRGARSVVQGLHEIAEHVGADALVIGPSHLSGPLRALRGDVALGALRDAPCAVAVAPAGFRDHGGELREVVVGWDGSDESAAALERAVEVATATGGGVRAVTAIEVPSDVSRLGGEDAVLVREWLDDMTAAAMSSFDRAREQVGGRVPVRCEVVEGRASEQLTRFGAGADLIVTGSRRYGPIRRLVLGSTSAGLLQDAEAPVLVVPRGVGDPPPPAGAPAASGTVAS